LHYDDVKYHRERPLNYTQWLDTIVGVQYPFTTSQLTNFHLANPTVAINLFGWNEEDGKAYIIQSAINDENRRMINILHINDHYVGIIHLDRLLNSRTNPTANGHNKRFYCESCLQPFYVREKLNLHMVRCITGKVQHCIMPAEKDFFFKNHSATISPSHIIYADTEALLINDNECIIHQPIAAAFLIVSPNEMKYRSFVGITCIKEFLMKLEDEVVEIGRWNQQNCRLMMKTLTLEEEAFHMLADTCYLCHRYFSENKCRDHDHMTGCIGM